MLVRDPQFRRRGLAYAGLTLLTLALYFPALQHGFIAYDDQQYVTKNPQVQAGLTWAGLKWAFGFHAGNWHPLTWLSHMLDCQLYGAKAGGHHLSNVLLHWANALLLLSVWHRLTQAFWPSVAVAALFAWHPLHVESVAWVAERKDLLCAFFWLLTLECYLRYVTQKSLARYLAVAGSFGLCLMAKPMGVTLPFVLLLLDYWPLQRAVSGRRLVVEKIPLLALAALTCGLTLAAQEMAVVSTAGLPVAPRLEHTVIAYQHYLTALFWPRNLAVYYPYERVLAAPTICVAIVVLGLITVLALKNFRRRPYLLMGWLWFLGTLVPVIGLVQVGDQAWADRYAYLPSIGLFISVVWLAVEFIRRPLVLKIIALAVAVGLFGLTAQQLGYWQNTRTLFTHANQVTRENYLAVTVLGSELAKAGKFNEAIPYYQTALRYKPGFPEAQFFLGNALDEQGHYAEAVAEYQKALWFRPTQEQTHIFLGIALGKQKKYDEASTHYLAALQLNPDSAVTHNNLARIYHTQGRLAEAIHHYEIALQLDPQLALAQNNLGILQLQQGELVQGTRHLRAAQRLQPDNLETQFNLALALNQTGEWREAAELFKQTQATQVANPKAHYEYATALAHLQRPREALSEYAASLLQQPDFPAALTGLAWILATHPQPEFRNGAEAVKLAERACELTGRNEPLSLRTLAAAYAEVGRFTEAEQTLQAAQNRAAQASPPASVPDAAALLNQFQHAEPWRSY